MAHSSARQRFRAWLLPAIVLQSVIVGGGYATGREVVQYAGRFGAAGWWAVLVLFAAFAYLSIAAFEVARTSQAYEYRKWIEQLIGPLWPLFDLLLLMMSLLVIAVMIAAIGSTLEVTLGIERGYGLLLAFVVITAFVTLGATAIERMKTAGSVVLYLGYILFAVRVLNSGVTPPSEATAQTTTALEAARSGLFYVGYNLSIYPAVLFCLHRQRSRLDSVISGVVAGAMIAIPFVLTFVCLLRVFPDPAVFDAEVPWLILLERATGGSTLWAALFGLVAGWTLVETAVGSIHAITHRIEQNVNDLPSAWRPQTGRLSRRLRFLLTIAFLAAAAALSRFGIIALVAKGYGAMAWGFILLLGLPLLVVGTRRLLLKR